MNVFSIPIALIEQVGSSSFHIDESNAIVIDSGEVLLQAIHPTTIKTPSSTLVIGLSLLGVLFIIVALLCINMGFVIWGQSINDQACTDAARAATDASDRDTAIKRAEAVLAAHAGDGYWLKTPVLDMSAFKYEDFDGNPPPTEAPYVTVSTQTTIRIPTPIYFYSASFLKDGSMKISNSHTFPIVKLKVHF